MTEKHIDLAKHCIGLDHKKPYRKNGKHFYKPYRNFFATGRNNVVTKQWDELCEKGYADRSDDQNGHGGYNYWLTKKGLDWLGEQLKIRIYDEID